MAIVKVNKFDSLQASLRDAIRKRMRGTAIAVEGARESPRVLEKANLLWHALSLTRLRRELPLGGSL